jgi:hypothetical protein
MELTPRYVAGSIEELIDGATSREPMASGDSKSGAVFERVTIDGERYIVKHLHVDDDWIMRSSGDLGCRPLTMWRSGLLDQLPECIDHAVVGAAAGFGRNGWGAALIMRDVSGVLVPEGDEIVPLAQHEALLRDMAALHARFWDWTDDIGLTPAYNRYLVFSPDCAALEARRGWPDVVPRLIVEGWQRFAAVAGAVTDPVLELVHDPSPLVDALARLPQTLVHGDWKFGNLGTAGDGRTVLLDWAVPGQAVATGELVWYLALNQARLPMSKEKSIECYRSALEAAGVPTSPWWDGAIALALLGGTVWFGWEKALGGPGDELAWWCDRAAEGLRFV